MSRSSSIDMVKTPLLKGIIIYSIPMILSGVLQILYNAADLVVVGRFAGANALASVGATSSIIHLIVNFFLNVSVGVSVVVAREIGSKNYEKTSNAIHTAYFMAIIFGIALVFLGSVLTKPMLELLNTPPEIIKGSEIYMRIFFLGAPASLVYNFGASILNASGDAKSPLVYLSISGIVNVILNLILVIVFGLETAGVAIATITSQYISAYLVTRKLIKHQDFRKLIIKNIRFYKKEFINILTVGIPVGVQGIAFSLSNVLIQSSINYFGAAVVAGNAASGSVEGFSYTALNGIARSALNFSAQNLGAKRVDRFIKTCKICITLQFLIGVLLGSLSYLFAKPLLGLYVSDTEAIACGAIRLLFIALPYFMCGIMETTSNMVRVTGHTALPMAITIIGVCVLRVFWIQFIFPLYKTPEMIYISYPVSWGLTILVQLICFAAIYKKEIKSYN